VLDHDDRAMSRECAWYSYPVVPLDSFAVIAEGLARTLLETG